MAHSEETKKKIKEGAKRNAEKKRLAIEEAQRIQDAQSERIAAISSPRDAYKYQFTDLALDSIQSVLNSTTSSGQLKIWSDFCDFIYERESQVRATVDLRMNSFTTEQMIISPKDETPEAIRAANFIRAQLEDICDLEKALKHLQFAEFNGCQVAELLFDNDYENSVYKEVDDNGTEIIENVWKVREIVPVSLSKMIIQLAEVNEKNEHTLAINKIPAYGDYEYMYYNQGDNGVGLGIDLKRLYPGKFLFHSPGRQQMQYRGVFRTLAYLFLQKKAGMSILMAGAERTAFKPVYALVPKGTNLATRNNIKLNLNSLTNDAVAVFDSDVQIKALEVDGASGSVVWHQLLSFVNSEIAKLILGGTLTIEASSGGANRALGEVMERTREDIVRSDAHAISQTLKHQLIQSILEKNLHLFDGKMPPLPKVYFDTRYREQQPIDQLMIDSGAVTINELRESRGLPPRKDGDVIAKTLNFEPMTQDPLQDPALAITGIGKFNPQATHYVGKEEKEDS